MTTVNIKIIDPTYAELAKALKNLGFKNQSTEDTFRYAHKKTGVVCTLPMKPDHAIVERGSYAHLTLVMEWYGLIKDRDELGQIIEINRRIEQFAAA
ncbi:MAG: hypothetical protein AAB316_23595 [Bacteroidota bacterium]